MTGPEIIVRPGGLELAAVQSLLREHLDRMAEISPPESCHALDATGLDHPDVTFWSAWAGDVLAGCGALRELDAEHGEVKSMRTVDGFLRRGVATRILETILDTARQRGYARLSLETGSMEEFLPARTLYARHGFGYCPPFGEYVLDPNSLYMTLEMK